MHEHKLPETETAVLVGVVTPDASRWDVNDSLDELAELASTAGAVVTDRMTQSLSRVNPTTYIGKGKVTELKSLIGARGSDLVIFDDDLSPVQVRNLEKALDCKLVDRSALILDIFATRARSAAAQTQVELAQLDYLRTRLTRHWTHLSRQKGGIGTKGPGKRRSKPTAGSSEIASPSSRSGWRRSTGSAPSSARGAKGLPAWRWWGTRMRASPR